VPTVGSTARDLAEKIIEWAHDPEKVEEMSKNARRMYEEELNWETTGKMLREVVGKVIQK
jgi:glycosyltransferase involved in cell wall biosynthesis